MWYLTPFFVFSVIGAIGLLSLLPMTRMTANKILLEQSEIGMGETQLAFVLLVNPLILLLVAAAIGSALADHAGLRSVLLDALRGRGAVLPDWRDLALAAGLGLLVSIIILLVQFAMQAMNWVAPGNEGSGMESQSEFRVSALLYGGVTEEIIMRFGLMTLLLWGTAMILRLENASEAGFAVWFAIVVSAVVFGLGHLSAAAINSPLTPTSIAAIVGLNAIAGIAYGWLYWRTSLEMSMVAHMATHIGFWTFGPALSQVIGQARA